MIVNVLEGKFKAYSSLVNMTPFVNGTQKGSNVVGEELGEIDGFPLGNELGSELGDPLGVELGRSDGEAEGDEEGVVLGEELFSQIGIQGNCTSYLTNLPEY